MDKKEGCLTKKYSWAVTGSFFAVLVGLSIAATVLPDAELSKEERRHYADSPRLTFETLLDGSYMSDLEEYLLDQFAGRDWFRTLKTEVETGLFGKMDANGYVRLNDGIYQLDMDWKETNVIRAAKEFATLRQELFAEADVYYALIPDKSYFLPKDQYPLPDDSRTCEQMQEYLTDATYIDLYPYLTIDDYYRTDLHWKQESVLDVAEVLCDAMGQHWEGEGNAKLVTSEFYGGYAGASAYEVTPDELYAVTSDVIEHAVVYDYEKKQNVTVYAPETLEGMDSYDYYLWGARALLTVKNPQAYSEDKLVLFRDSFGSSMAPLLLESYAEITLVDLRYISADYLAELIDTAEYDDVLFLFSQRVLRHSDSMKF